MALPGILAITVLVTQTFGYTNFFGNHPRFKTNNIETSISRYLGDRFRFRCLSTGDPKPDKIKWFRNGEKLEFPSYDDRLHSNDAQMSLEVKRIEVSDQGKWRCEVSNKFGTIHREFTMDIVDFCDFFETPMINASDVPMRCVCFWNRIKKKLRKDIDFSVATSETCRPYMDHMRKIPLPRPCVGPNCASSLKYAHDTVPSRLLDEPDPVRLFDMVAAHGDFYMSLLYKDLFTPKEKMLMDKAMEGWKHLNKTERIKRARAFLVERRNLAIAKSLSSDEDMRDRPLRLKSTVSPSFGGPGEAPPSLQDPTPYVKVVQPAGRTLRLTCKAFGKPDPMIYWMKDGRSIVASSQRATGAKYITRPYALELEDPTESDSGKYSCEAYNKHGNTSTKVFNVTILTRMRSPPIVVPNVMQNLTVNVNETATFKCRVISDLLPHIMWARIEKTNGGYTYFNETAKEELFKYTEIESNPNVAVVNNGNESTLILHDVTLADQGLYVCISGNSLGMSMQKAYLTVNEFKEMTLLTGSDKPGGSGWTSMLVVILFTFVVCLLGVLAFTAFFIVRQQKKKHSMQREALLPKKKMVIVTRKRPDDADGGWSDLPSSYQVQIIEKEGPVPSAKGRRPRLNSDLTVFSEYEVETDPKWEIDRSRLELIEVLGEGAFGEVWKGLLKMPEQNNDKMPVAVKRLKNSAHEKELIDLVSEMQMFKTIGIHENILSLIGCCTGAGPLYVILELCIYGNLRDFLRAHRPQEEKDIPVQPEVVRSPDDDDYLCPKKVTAARNIIENLTQRHLVEFAWQVAKGMQYMASLKVIHRDLAARNVLVADNFTMKISDFGLSRDVQNNDYYRKKGNGRLPIKWMAIEALDSHVYTVESDVWSFGILLWEIMTLGGTPYPTIAMPQLYACLKEGYRMEAPHNCPDEIYNLMVACWQEKRESRPTFETIVDYFDWMLTESAKEEDNQDEETTVRSGSSGDFGGSSANSSSAGGSFSRKKKMRPLSAPVFFPKEVQARHDICDDEPIEPDFPLGSGESSPPTPLYTKMMVFPTSKDHPPPIPIHSPITRVEHSEGPDSAIGSPSAGDGDDNGETGEAEDDLRKKAASEYVNLALGSKKSRFQFPPTKFLMRFSDTTMAAAQTMFEGTGGGATNLGYMPSPLPQSEQLQRVERRFSTSSHTSSGHGGSSAMSSAEGLGGIGEFCRVEMQNPRQIIRQLPRQANSLDAGNTVLVEL